MSRPDCRGAEGPKKLQGTERRAWIRYPRRLRTLWQLFGTARQDDCWVADLRDVSLTGLGLVVNRSFTPGTVLTVRLQTGSRKFTRTMLVRVKHCAAQSNSDSLVGCSFVVKLKDDDLQDLLA